MRDKAIAIYTRQFPKPGSETDGLFTAQAVSEMGRRNAILVVCPIPWCPNFGFMKRWPSWYANATIPRESTYQGVDVYYPRFLVIPYLTRIIQPLMQAFALLPLLIRLKRSRNIAVINAHCLYPDGIAATLLGMLLKLPVILTSLGSDINQDMTIRWKRFQIIWALRNASAITAKSKALVSKIYALGITDKVYYVPNGVDVSRFADNKLDVQELRSDLGLDANELYCLFVGRLNSVKGLSTLLAAISSLKEQGRLHFKTLVIGEGEMRAELEEYIARNDLNAHISLLGEIPHDQVARWMMASDFLCLPSRMEGLPNVIMEALACGLPVVASNVGGVPELVNQENGVLVQPDDPEELAKALQVVAGREWDKAGIRSTISWACWSMTADRYLDVYKSVAS